MPSIPKEVIDQFVTGPMSAEAVEDISMALKKALIERAYEQSSGPARSAQAFHGSTTGRSGCWKSLRLRVTSVKP